MSHSSQFAQPRWAVVTVRNAEKEADALRVIGRMLPSNYTVSGVRSKDTDPLEVLIHGTDSAGWTLDGYVIPRLASGLYGVREVFPNQLAPEEYAQTMEEDR